MASSKVIVFGPTGAVGSFAARTASELGAPVILAMRDVEKPIPSLSGHFERVHADLTRPDTVHNAVKMTGAKRAFLYRASGTSDHMRSTIEALKDAGIELVVFLSSFTVSQGELEDYKPNEPIPYWHAQVEINLGNVFGKDGFVAVRPGSFASNTVQLKSEIEEGVVRIYKPDRLADCIVPGDIGSVCGIILAKGPQDEARAILLYGPQLMTQIDIVKTLSKVLGKELKIETIEKQEAYELLVKRRASDNMAKFLIEGMERATTGRREVWGKQVTKEQMLNVEKYSGRKATTFEDWAEQNKHRFMS